MKRPPLPPNEEKRMAALRDYRILDTLPEKAYDDITFLASYICKTPVALISLLDTNRQWFKSRVGLEVTETPREVAFCSYAILNDEVMQVPDATRDERFRLNPLVTSEPRIRFYAGAPLINPEGLKMGTLCVIDFEPRGLDPEQLRALEALANEVISHFELRCKLLQEKETNARLQATQAAAERANQAKSDFLASMSHELRTPLNSVIGFARVLKRNRHNNLHPQDLTYLERIAANGQHLLALINDVLDLSKVEAGQISLQITSIALDILILDVIEQLESQANEQQVILQADLPSSLMPLQTDVVKLKQVLLNLVGNALKFTRQGQVTVRLEADPENGQARCIEVIDTGIGIPKDRLDAIFDAFQQVDSSTSREYGGTGLGLTISRSLCQLMGYQLTVNSKVGSGSSFCIHLAPDAMPARHGTNIGKNPQPADHASGAEIATAMPESQTATADKVVLVIDDDVDSRTLLIHTIEDLGLQTIVAGSGQLGLHMARQYRPDLITLDLMMPGMTGWEVLQTLKQDPELRHIPVVIISVVAKENHHVNFGLIDLLDKPVSGDELHKIIKRNLRIE